MLVEAHQLLENLLGRKRGFGLAERLREEQQRDGPRDDGQMRPHGLPILFGKQHDYSVADWRPAG